VKWRSSGTEEEKARMLLPIRLSSTTVDLTLMDNEEEEGGEEECKP